MPERHEQLRQLLYHIALLHVQQHSTQLHSLLCNCHSHCVVMQNVLCTQLSSIMQQSLAKAVVLYGLQHVQTRDYASQQSARHARDACCVMLW